MRIPGSYWWVAALVTCLMAALAIVFPTLYLGGQITQDITAGTFSYFSALSDAVFAPVYVLIFLAGSVYPGYYAAWSLGRLRRRKSAINGYVEAMPLAFPPATSGDIPNLTSAPLVLHWRIKRSIPPLFGVLMPTLSALQAIPGLAIFGFLVWNLAQQPDKFGYIEANLTQLIVLAVVSAASVALWVTLIQVYRFQAKHSFGVTATPEGLECIHELGQHTFIPWGEARLFEVELRSKFVLGPRIWRLYSSQDVAEWVHRIVFDRYIPDGISALEMKQREDVLACIIATHSGLQLRTISKRLIAPDGATAIVASHAPTYP